MKYKLIAIDVDDTLISDHRDISEEDDRAIRAATHSGVNVILASGRGFDGVRPYNERLGLTGYSICAGGGQIFDGNGELIFADHIEEGAARELMEWADERGVYYQAYSDDGYYYREHTKWTDYYFRHCGYEGALAPDLPDRPDIRSSKIILFGEPSEIEALTPKAREAFPGLNVLTSSAFFLEAFGPDTNKGAALARVSDMLGVSKGEIIAIGDSEIDVPMFEYAGLGCAAPDASARVKAASDYVCTDNGRCVAEVLDKYVL
jgi:Cof subfamily protein (haloacid dehalogenase superfamily)